MRFISIKNLIYPKKIYDKGHDLLCRAIGTIEPHKISRPWPQYNNEQVAAPKLFNHARSIFSSKKNVIANRFSI